MFRRDEGKALPVRRPPRAVAVLTGDEDALKLPGVVCSGLNNRTLGRKPGAFRLDPSPVPRRAAETEVGTVALASALLIHAGFSLAAHVMEVILLAAALAVMFGGFCLGSFVYHLLSGRWRFALQTLPWAR